MEKKIEIKKQILDAANERFNHYGYNKTTMAEIANDCDMTAGNLYRYFQNKEEIITQIAVQCMQLREETLRKLVENHKSDVTDLLLSFVLKNLEYSFEEFSQQKKIYELIEFITRRQRKLLDQHLKNIQSLISLILKKGRETKEFKFDDTEVAAEAVLNATTKFMAPSFMVLYSLEDLQRMARNVIRLVVEGLKK
ncbi:MAG: hypothetical protein CMD96_03520 [Gammaproteobacteria bacterium]|jgi:AcrR family transcriptional regulator|nr:hypothetical protein [Gammaproteobacteria bacterium]HJP19089.1 TetR/AcrR family transcriptional regulator [Nitrospinota bacterium]